MENKSGIHILEGRPCTKVAYERRIAYARSKKRRVTPGPGKYGSPGQEEGERSE